MTATIYTTNEAMVTVRAIKDLDYYDRCCLADSEETDLRRKAGYYLKTTHERCPAPLPENAVFIAAIRATDANYSERVSFPENLRGCVFEKAPQLPPRYKEIIKYCPGNR